VTGAVLIGPVVAPLLAAGLLVLAPARPLLRRIIGMGVSAGVLVLAAALLGVTAGGGVVSERLAGWPPGVAIVFAADALAATMLTVTAVLVVASLAFAAATGEDAHPLFVPLVLVLSAGVFGAYLTADLFNLFVFVEVMLVPSYVLVVIAGRRGTARLYVTVNLLASTVFLAGLALVYGVTGTVNLGELAGAAADPAAAAAAAVVLLALAVKAAVVPLHGWLPRTYSDAPAAVTVLFSGLLTKVGVYVIVRVYAVVFDGAPDLRWVVLMAALVTMVVGVLGAVGESGLRPILTFHMVSQVGYILLGLAVFTVAGLTAAIFFLVQYVLVKAALLMCAGAVERTYGTGDLARLGGLVRHQPVLAATFAVAALGLAGIPPLSGFVAKLALVTATIDAEQYLAAGIALAVGLLTLTSMLKVWNGVFWREDPEPAAGGAVRTRVAASVTAQALALAALTLVLGPGAQPLLAVAEVAASGLVDTTAYVTAVTGR
jgi:multicomponent Na+:H+ antiporter subunit D